MRTPRPSVPLCPPPPTPFRITAPALLRPFFVQRERRWRSSGNTVRPRVVVDRPEVALIGLLLRPPMRAPETSNRAGSVCIRPQELPAWQWLVPFVGFGAHPPPPLVPSSPEYCLIVLPVNCLLFRHCDAFQQWKPSCGKGESLPAASPTEIYLDQDQLACQHVSTTPIGALRTRQVGE
jgi:hypothetical protein